MRDCGDPYRVESGTSLDTTPGMGPGVPDRAWLDAVAGDNGALEEPVIDRDESPGEIGDVKEEPT